MKQENIPAFFSDSIRNKAALALLSMQRHNWEQGTAMQAFYEAGRMDVVVCLAREAANRSLPDGRVAMNAGMSGITDPCSCGEAMIAAARETGEESLIAAEKNLRTWALVRAPRNEKGIVYHLTGRKQFWADSFYMLPPYLIAAGEIKAGLCNFYGLWDALYDREAGLLCHIWDDGTKTMEDPKYWGTGNGWALAALARIIPALPKEYEKDRQKMIQMASDLLDRVLSMRQSDGSFRDVLDDPSSFQENNICQMAAYTIYAGIRDGWIADTYRKEADELRSIALSSMDGYGFIHDVCGAPDFKHSGISPEAQAFTILCETSRLSLVSFSA